MKPIKVMTYNVHGCVGLDFRRSERRIAEVISSFQPDIVGLQELDLSRKRSGKVDQAGIIAQELGFHQIFHPAMSYNEEKYGDAVLSRWPIKPRKLGDLPSKKAFPFRENRGAIWVEIETPSGPLQVINTHFGVGCGERLEQATALAGAEWAGVADMNGPLLVMGDFNSLPDSPAYRVLVRNLADVSKQNGGQSKATFPTFLPVFTLDYIFVNRRCKIAEVSLGVGNPARMASDHFPLIAQLILD